MISELFWQCGIFRNDFWTVLTVWYFATWFLNCSDSVLFFNMISELFWQCIFPTWFLNCSHRVVFPTWFLNCSDSVVFPTSLRSYSDSVVFFYMISELVWQCSISYIVSELFWQCCVFLHDFVTALTMLYFSACFSTRFQNCSDSVVFFYKILELFWHCGIFLYVSVQGHESELSCVCVLGVSVFASVLGFYCMISNCSHSVVFFYMTSELLWQRCIFFKCFSTWFRNCSDSVVFY